MAYTAAPPVDLSLWLPHVLPHVPGAPRIAVRQVLVAAAIEFCEGSRVWKSTESADALAGDGRYAVPCPSLADAVVVDGIRFNGVALVERTPDQLAEMFTDWRNEPAGTPVYFTALDQDSVALVPAPDTAAAGAIVVDGSYKPVREATSLPSVLYRTYVEAIASGALARLMAAPGKSWSNPDAARFHLDAFNGAIAAAAVDAARGFTRAPIRVRGYN